jgi:CHAT domain-containing protein
VTHLPSAASLPAIRGDHAASSVDEANGHVFAPFPSDLPSTAREAEAFMAAMPRSTSYRGSAATEAALRLALASPRVVHVATHGSLNARNPMFSRIELSRPRGGGSVEIENDGRLEVHELIGLVIRSPLVFFSGCETGAGQAWTDDPVRGTADHTLAQAALAAGAGNVVSTLWRIDDAGAAEFARRFYAHLSRGSVSGALAAAQREMAADARYANPYFWAGYTLSGEGRYGESQSEAAASVLISIPQGADASGPLS